MKKSALLTYFFVVLLTSSCAQKSDKSIKIPEIEPFNLTLIANEISNPWGMAFLPNMDMLITEKSGKMFLLRSGKLREIKNLPEIYVRGQGGLMDVAIHPNYDKNGWLYFSYSSKEGSGSGGNTAIARAKIKEYALSDIEVLYKGVPNTTKGQHFGSRLLFDNNGLLYFSIGDRGNRDVNPQDVTRDGGKIYRIKDNGEVPHNNPFYNQNGAKKAIYSFGHRNPQGLTLHPVSGEIWEHEHGPRGGDEINIIEKGKNYGWPEITYGINYIGTKITDETSRPGMEQPIYQWTPSIAPCGMTFVNSNKYPEWDGNLLVGSLSFQYLERLVLQNNKVVYREKLLDGIGRVRNVKQGPDGYIYIGVEGKGIFKLEPK